MADKAEKKDAVEAEAKAPKASKTAAADKAARADYVINTDGTFDETDRQVASVVKALTLPLR